VDSYAAGSDLSDVIRWDEFYMAPSATTINENGKHWQYAVPRRVVQRSATLLFSREKAGLRRDPAMKKISRVATQSRNCSQPKLTIGLDLGDRSSWYCVLDEQGEVVLEQKLRTTPKAMKEVFGGMPRSRIALGTGMHSPWVSRLLGELGHEVIVAHARSVRWIGETRKKDDRRDAQTLARLARIDPQLLSPVKHR
jgi:hypothetical protein